MEVNKLTDDFRSSHDLFGCLWRLFGRLVARVELVPRELYHVVLWCPSAQTLLHVVMPSRLERDDTGDQIKKLSPSYPRQLLSVVAPRRVETLVHLLHRLP